ncbi:aminomethyl-transferring glycine dehydrogenase subunit GcvPA [Candidatus Woesearchaeota archaeon]|nr:aminomethyl-transferring glycine dehydrogenase subunit GcvPA [Candidatus Woesearchaeota archaeon]
MDFIPKNIDEERAMLKDIGIVSIKGLFADIPEEIQKKAQLNLPEPLSELQLRKKITYIARKNRAYKTSFLGAGCYSHYIPAIVSRIISKPEFCTAYTPYQAEISQGILQAIFEYQTMICDLTGMDASNASVYDGAEALAEAALISLKKTGRSDIIISKTVHPEYRQTVRTYLNAKNKNLVEIDIGSNGKTDIEKLKSAVNHNTAGILIQSPNFLGAVEDIMEVERAAHKNNSLLTVSVADTSCLGILAPPGKLGADIVTAEGQSFGNPKSFGGSLLGIIAVKQGLIRHLPGRIVGQAVDREGKKGYMLTLQAREQHIRREKASCNICSNQALNALAATVYLTALGKNGIINLANLNLQKAHYAYESLKEFKVFSNSLLYNEFVIQFRNKDNMKRAGKELEKNSIEPGLDLEKFYPALKNCMLICVTEMNSKQDIDRFIEIVKKNSS